MALTVVVVILVMLALISAYVTQLGYNQRAIGDSNSGLRVRAYYRAQAGAVEAATRIRTDYTVGLAPGGSFAVDAYDPNPYDIDVDGDAVNDATVDIGPVLNAALKNRQILSNGCDTTAPC